ncbi:MAG: hypothetical protein ACTIJY_06540 [Luteimonas sp.]
MNVFNPQNGLQSTSSALQAQAALQTPYATQSYTAGTGGAYLPLSGGQVPGGYAAQAPSAYINPFSAGAPSAYADPFGAYAPSAYAAPDATAGMTPLASGNNVTTDPTMLPYTQYLATEGTARPAGDDRSAQDIIDDNPVLKNLGNQSGIRDKLNDFVGGDMYNNPDQAFQAAALLTNIKSLTQADGQPRSVELQGNGKIDGFTKDGDARHGTEAGVLQDITKHGLDYLVQLNGRLPSTDDKQVNADGTNINNWDHIRDTYLSPILGGLSSVAGMIPHPAAQAASAGLGAAGTVIDTASTIANGTATPTSLITAGTGLLQQGIDTWQGLRPQPTATPAAPTTTTAPATTPATGMPSTIPGTPIPVASAPVASSPSVYSTGPTVPVASSLPNTIPGTPAPVFPTAAATGGLSDTAALQTTSPLALRYY